MLAQHLPDAVLGPDRIERRAETERAMDAGCAPARTGSDLCPANHASPFMVRLVPGAPGYDSTVGRLGSPEVRARAEGTIALMPHRESR